MENIELKYIEFDYLTIVQLKELMQEKEFREFIQLLLLENKKGENGLLFKYIVDNHTKIEEEFVIDEIEKFNEYADDWELWRKPARQIYEDFSKQYNRNFQNDISEQKKIHLFLLFTLNYVFISYTNKRFRKFIDVKKRKIFGSKLQS